MQLQPVRVSESRHDPDLLRRVHGSVFRCLRNRHGARLNVMIVPEIVQMLRNVVAIDFSIASRNGRQLAADMFFRSSALGGVDVRGLSANHGVEGERECLKPEYVGSRSAEHEKDLGMIAEMIA